MIIHITYIIALIFALLVSNFLLRRHLARWQRSKTNFADLSHYELAFLMGGSVRVVQLLIAQLVKFGHLRQKKKMFGFSLMPTGKTLVDQELEPSEKRFLQQIAVHKSIAVSDWKKWKAAAESLLQSCEARLAILGIMPTQEEVKNARMHIALPFTLLWVSGIFLSLYQYQQNESPFILACMTLATWILSMIVTSRVPKITSHGQHLIGQAQKQALASCDNLALQVACLGVIALASDEVCHHLLEPFRSMAPPADRSESGGSGCGSGCGGDSGCGSGCGGGCGGGGD